jgi:hypothetical protein
MNTRLLLLTACAMSVLVAACAGVTPEPEEPESTNTPVPTSTVILPTPELTDTPTPLPPVIFTNDGFRIVYTGALEAQAGGTLEVVFQVFGPDEQPAQGTFFATLGDPPSDPRATHANGQLDREGRIALSLNVNWLAGITKLYCGFHDQVYEVATITINP